ncbi:nascent polypeptide-associated complex protein [Candidatus Woesearchaeota archaeon]|nr:nascent polypeptide-associated complex protein [Candidatus Woesearchaeota archaeon]
MMPNLDPRMMKQAMKRMGIKQEELDAEQVIIRLHDKDLILDAPSVSKVNMMGQESYQISGEVREVSRDEPEGMFSEEDIATVMEQAHASKEEATKALEESGGDLAAAIMELKAKE